MVYLNLIYFDLYELSNLELQKKVWLGNGLDINYVSSYTELMCRLFDDDLFDEFVLTISKKHTENKSAEKMELIENIIILQTKLNEYNDNFEKQNLEDIEILADPDWHYIINIAEKIVSNWGYYMYLYLKD